MIGEEIPSLIETVTEDAHPPREEDTRMNIVETTIGATIDIVFQSLEAATILRNDMIEAMTGFTGMEINIMKTSKAIATISHTGAT
jgi:hypothetical protein